MIPVGRTAPRMQDVYCDVARIRRANQLADSKPGTPRHAALLAEIHAELEAQFGPKANWGCNTKHAREQRGETVTKPTPEPLVDSESPKQMTAAQRRAYRARQEAAQ